MGAFGHHSSQQPVAASPAAVAGAQIQANSQASTARKGKASVYGAGFDGTIADTPLGNTAPLGTAQSVLGGS